MESTANEAKNNQLTVTALLNKAMTEFCLNFCKYADECTEAMERNEDLRPCPLDIVGG